MAGNKANAKTKGKEDRSKVSKGATQSNEDDEGIDFAVLRKPIPTSVTGFAQARKIFDLATEELKDLLANECDLMYECKVCRNIFRSLANFISHKRVYCKEKFSTTVHSHFVNNTSTQQEYLRIKRLEEAYQKTLKVTPTSCDGTDDKDDRIPLSKDITAVYEKIINARESNLEEDQQVVLKKIPSSSVAVFQNLGTDDKASDSMKTQVQELDQILSRKRAVLQIDGKFTIEDENVPPKELEQPDPSDTPDAAEKQEENVIQISDDDDIDDGQELKCKICDLQFSTMKTLKFHMKYKHLESRLVYPCPDCLEIFSTSWSVYRHLFKVHRKTAAQIRRLRESIQSKAFKMNNPPAFYEKRKNVKQTAPQPISEEERRDQENQAWMDNMEGDGEVPRCGGCGRTFERRAALAAHTHTCQPRSRALARTAPRPDAKKIEIQIRKDYNKGATQTTGISLLKPTSSDNKPAAEETEPKPKPQDEEKDDDDGRDMDEDPMDIEDDDQKSTTSESPEKPEKSDPKPQDTVKPVIRLPYNSQAEKSNLAAFKQRIAPEIDIGNLQCKKCEAKLNSALELHEHMADHYKWMRYACKLCNFKHYSFEKLPEHVKTVHKLKGDSDFYYTTVKAIDGKEAMMMSTCMSESSEENVEPNEDPESRRPSRCSSDSSRLSDDSSSSNNLKEATGKKRKMVQNRRSSSAKKKKDGEDEDQEEPKDKVSWRKSILISENKTSPSVKPFEENSSDMDEVDEKINKRQDPLEDPHASLPRRPVRKRTKVKNADFEYDLSNLLKMEAQGYRDSNSQTSAPATPAPAKAPPAPAPKPSVLSYTKTLAKKKSQPEASSTIESLNQDCIGAMLALSKKAVELAAAQMKNLNFPVYSAKERPSVFARPTIPRILARGDKSSPRKDLDEIKDNNEAARLCKIAETVSLKSFRKDLESLIESNKSREPKVISLPKSNIGASNDAKASHSSAPTQNGDTKPAEQNGLEPVVIEKVTTLKQTIPAVVPLKFRRQSLDLTNHPAISKNITDFTKAGMKTKILVIKPIHRNKDGSRPANTPLKFQTIKLRESKGSSEATPPMVVKVPKVPSTTVTEVDSVDPLSIADVSPSDATEKKTEENVVNNISRDLEEAVMQQVSTVQHKECEGDISVMEPVSEYLDAEPENDVENPKSVEVAAT
ncbi:hypothetical protein NE865_01322 [Phthorimaea operculella]|nr:hypothetical protein NE865_01322 [Phthorimaea operculella]